MSEGRGGQVYTFDAMAASALILMNTISLLFIQQLHVARIYKAPDEVLGAFCKDERFIQVTSQYTMLCLSLRDKHTVD
ncbi:MAG: hypothetical protein J7L11_05410 [Thermoprotei archaeon]|nr:hypothetical protein [Thermoprotei archaeon]